MIVMTITLLEFFFGLLLLAVPAVLIYVFRLPLQPRFFRCVGRFLVTMAVAGGAMYGVELVNSVWLNIVVFLLLTLLSALFAVGKARVGQRRILLPVFVGLLVPTLLVVLYVGFLVLGQQRLFDASLLLPLAGLTAGASMGCNARALSTYYMGLEHHGALYYYLLGNGATHSEALRYFVKRSLQASLLLVLKEMGTIMTSVCPVLFWMSLLSGMQPLTAAALQVILVAAMAAVSSGSLVLTLFLARRYSFDGYGRLKK